MPRLLVCSGEGTGTTFEFDGDVALGRSSANAIRIQGNQISRVHARIVRRGGDFVILDEGSRNGILVNDRRVPEHVLRDGDRVQIGTVGLVFNPDFDFKTRDGVAEGILLVRGGDEGEKTQGLSVTARIAPGDLEIRPGAKPRPGEDLETLRRRPQALYDVSDLVIRAPDAAALARDLARLLMDAVRADRVVLLQASPDGKDVTPLAVERREGAPAGVSISRTVLAAVLAERKALLSADAVADPRFDTSASMTLDPVQSLLAVPLAVGDRFLGVLYADTRSRVHPFGEEDLRLLAAVAGPVAVALEGARRLTRSRDEASGLGRRVQEERPILGESPAIRRVLEQIRKVAETDATVLITGETGTGKELAAQAIHFGSPRRGKPFVAVDCTTIAETLLESELFGHEKGAFTGADRTRPGKFEAADGGTLFLDEVGNMNLSTQSKLLRFFEDRRFTRVGSVQLRSTDVRIVCATHVDLEAAVKAGTFRQDLFYRMSVVPVPLPPLRERRADLPALADHFLRKSAAQAGVPPKTLDASALSALMDHDWPGNIRELRNILERAAVLVEGAVITAKDLTLSPPRPGAGAEIPEGAYALPAIIAEVEKTCIRRALDRARGRKAEAARLLDISRPTLDKKIKEYGIEVT